MCRQNRLLIVLCAIFFLRPTGWSAGQSTSTEPKITDVRIVAFSTPTDNKVTFTLAIEGENLPDNNVKVMLETKDPASPASVGDAPGDITSSSKEILAKGTAKVGAEITRISLSVNNRTVAKTDAFTVSIKENPPAPKLKQFEIKFDHQKNKEFPNLHSLFVTKESGDSEVGFADNPHWMTVDLVPTGATDLNIVMSNNQQLDLHFVAATDYEPKSVVITVYNSSDLDKRKACYVSIDKKPAEDPAQPKITPPVEIVFINRSHGMGRIRIYGKGFGDYPPPPYPVDDYLWNCLEEFHIRATKPEWAQDAELTDLEARIQACAQVLNGTPPTFQAERAAIETDKKAAIAAGDKKWQQLLEKRQNRLEKKESQLEALRDGKQAIDDEIVAAIKAGNKKRQRQLQERQKRLQEKQRQLELEDIKRQLELAKTNLAVYVEDPRKDWEKWGKEIRDKVTVSVNSRNPDIRVEKVEILDINDKMIDVYFEFTRYRGYAWPFRLADATVTVRKMLPKTTQTVKNDKVTGTVVAMKEATYTVPYQPGPKRDLNLTYKYTVLDKKSANTLLGKGIADNFYVLQLSVVNNGDKKVTIPLSAIQAEVDWLRGKNKAQTLEYMAGPPTLAPIPLAAVSAYFDAYQKAKGPRAILFNTLDGLRVLGAGLVPFTGPSFKDAQVVFAGPFVEGLHKALGDLSGQQLQNLTALSWESSETLPAKGGSIEKLIYIQKNEQFSSKPVEVIGVTKETRKQIANIMDLEITGFEVVESEAKQATPTPAKPPATQTTPSQTTPQSPAPAPPTTPAQPVTPPKDKKKQ